MNHTNKNQLSGQLARLERRERNFENDLSLKRRSSDPFSAASLPSVASVSEEGNNQAN